MLMMDLFRKKVICKYISRKTRQLIVAVCTDITGVFMIFDLAVLETLENSTFLLCNIRFLRYAYYLCVL